MEYVRRLHKRFLQLVSRVLEYFDEYMYFYIVGFLLLYGISIFQAIKVIRDIRGLLRYIIFLLFSFALIPVTLIVIQKLFRFIGLDKRYFIMKKGIKKLLTRND